MSQPPQPQTADPVAFVHQHGLSWLNEAQSLRQVAIPSVAHPPPSFHAALLQAQGQLDRLETILRLAVALKGSTARKARDAEDRVDDDWAREAEADRRTARTSRDFEGARERYAIWDTKVFEQRREARQCRKAAMLAAEVEQQVRDIYFGLQGVRTVLLASLRYFAAPLPGSVDQA